MKSPSPLRRHIKGVIKPARPKIDWDGSFIGLTIAVYATCVSISFAIARLMIRLWWRAWQLADQHFSQQPSSAVPASAPTHADTVWARLEIGAAGAGILAFAVWRTQNEGPDEVALTWIRHVIQGALLSLVAFLFALAWVTTRQDRSQPGGQTHDSRDSLVTAAKYAATLLPLLTIPELGRSIWGGSSEPIASGIVGVIAAALLSCWFAYWIRASMIVTAHRFHTRGTGSKVAFATGIAVGSLNLVVAVTVICLHGIGSTPLALFSALGSIVMPTCLLALSWSDYQRR